MVDLYIARQSWLHRTDPRIKLVGVICSLLILFIAKNLWFMLAVLVLVHGLYASAQIPRANLVAVWKTLLPVSLLMALLWTLFYPSGPPLFQVWIFTITPLALAQGLVLALRILSIGLIVTLWLYTTETNSIVQGLVQWHVPFAWGLVLTLAFRYIHFVHESYVTISEAQQARGLNLSDGNPWQRVRVMLPIFITMMISVLRTSDHLAKALEARGFGAPSPRRTSLYELELTSRDYVLLLLLLAVTLLFLLLHYAYGFASDPISLF